MRQRQVYHLNSGFNDNWLFETIQKMQQDSYITNTSHIKETCKRSRIHLSDIISWMCNCWRNTVFSTLWVVLMHWYHVWLWDCTTLQLPPLLITEDRLLFYYEEAGTYLFISGCLSYSEETVSYIISHCWESRSHRWPIQLSHLPFTYGWHSDTRSHRPFTALLSVFWDYISLTFFAVPLSNIPHVCELTHILCMWFNSAPSCKNKLEPDHWFSTWCRVIFF